ncbi:MAG: hypothetical protein ABI425_06040 [Patescibacteria group bacterium]
MSEFSLPAQEFEQKKQEKSLKPELSTQLEKTLSLADHVIWGHGTLSELSASSILDQGISGNPNYDLFNIATPLTSNEKSDAENIDYILQQVQDWPHKNAKYVVLLAIPYGIKPNNVVERTLDEKKGERSSIPMRFIVGYIDVDKQTFIKNPLFISNAEPTRGLIQQKSSPLLDRSAIQKTQVIQTETQSVIEGTDDIW